MYRAKAAGQGGYARYDPETHTELVARVQLEADLRRALEAGAEELFLQYQPTFDLGSGQLVGPRPWPGGGTRPGDWGRRPSSSPWPRPAA